jgi:transcriptional regulator, propionate catabolism operon regulatory protein
MKVLAIAPYDGLKELMIELGRIEKLDIQVEVGDLEKGVKLASRAVENGIDIIISRGGTAELIQKKVSIPVIEIEVSGYDMLRVLTLVKDYPGKAAIVGFPPISEGAATICKILEIDISAYVISMEEEVRPTLMRLLEEGYDVIIGDAITVKEAANLGLNGVLITSGKESIMKSFEVAKKMHHYFFSLRQRLLIAQQILQEEEEGIVVYDQLLKVIYSNTCFTESLYEIFERTIHIKEAVSEVLATGNFSIVMESSTDFWNITGKRLDGYEIPLVVFRAQKITTKTNELSNAVKIISEPNKTIPIKTSFTKNSEMRRLEEIAERYSEKDDSIWISGERGTSKEKIAQFIHFRSSKRSYPFLNINCALLTDNHWSHLLNSDEKSLLASNDRGTIFLKNIDSLSLSVQQQLLSYLITNHVKSRFITSSCDNILAMIERGAFSHDLYYFLAQLTLSMPPLLKRKEDIDQLSRIFISDFNTKYGKQIVGIRNEAIEELENFSWPGNISQLKQTISEGVLLAEGPFIEKEDIRNILKSKLIEAEQNNLDTIGTLEEIEQKIIKKVWLEEGMNQTKTAERLGINRTTLWRKLKDI